MAIFRNIIQDAIDNGSSAEAMATLFEAFHADVASIREHLVAGVEAGDASRVRYAQRAYYELLRHAGLDELASAVQATAVAPSGTAPAAVATLHQHIDAGAAHLARRYSAHFN